MNNQNKLTLKELLSTRILRNLVEKENYKINHPFFETMDLIIEKFVDKLRDGLCEYHNDEHDLSILNSLFSNKSFLSRDCRDKKSDCTHFSNDGF